MSISSLTSKAMDLGKLSLESPMHQSNDDDLFDEAGLNDDDLLREDIPPVDVVPRAQPEGRHAPTVESFSFPNESDFVCDYVDADAYKSRGTLLQFINQNCADAASVIGCVRIPVSEAPLLPAYLARNRQLIRQHAIRHLSRHLIDVQSAAGAGEKLCDDDYGMSYMLASTSKAARALQPLGKQEGPLQFCLYPHLNAPVTLYINPDGSREKVHVINVYIHLYDVNRRRRAIIMRAEENRVKAEEAKTAASLAAKTAAASAPLQSAAVKRKSSGPPPAAVAHPYHIPAHHWNYNLPRQPPASVARQMPPQPPAPQMPLPPPPAPESYPPMPVDHAPINWPASPKLPDFPKI